MSTKDNGGPAFPSMRDMRHNPDFDHEEGMTLRDYFAAKVMQADMTDGIHESDFARTALRAYRMADVMMAARKK
jgi:hypothetical protein